MAVNVKDDTRRTTAAADLKQIAAATVKLMGLHARADELEEQAKTIRAQARVLEEVTIPEMMDACGVKDYTLASGHRVKVQQIIAGSIPAKNKDAAFRWLRTNGHGSLIKREIKVALGRDSDTLLAKVERALQKIRIPYTNNESVHPQTLGAFAREAISEGIDLPLDLLGVYVGRRVKLEAPTP